MYPVAVQCGGNVKDTSSGPPANCLRFRHKLLLVTRSWSAPSFHRSIRLRSEAKMNGVTASWRLRFQSMNYMDSGNESHFLHMSRTYLTPASLALPILMKHPYS